MADSATSMTTRFVEATKRMGLPDAQDFDKDRISRLREDINAFRRDLKYLDNGGTIILTPDSAEIDSYLRPEQHLANYCFPLDDRATFDIAIAKSEKRIGSFDRSIATQKVSRRILRARAHLFNSRYRNILLPPYLSELDVTLSMILAARGRTDLDAVFQMIGNNISKLETIDGDIVGQFSAFASLSETERSKLLDSVFEKVLSNPIIYANDLSLDQKDQRISQIVRANDFLLNSKSDGIEDYDWSQVIVIGESQLLEQLRSLTPDNTMVQHLEELFFRLPKSTRTNLAIYADAQALGYIAAINDRLQRIAAGKIKVQLVTWALSPVTVARAYWPETEGNDNSHTLVEIRHPKLLAAAINFANVDRAQVEADLDRLSQALSLYEVGSEPKDSVGGDKSLNDVRSAWAQLDNTLLAWTVPIKVTNVSDASPRERKLLEIIRQAVTDHRKPFEDYLVRKIDDLSKALSDSHWEVVQPQDVGDIDGDCLFHESGHCIVIRPQADHARFAIAVYDSILMERIYEDFKKGKSFGRTLVELISTQDVGERDVDVNQAFRAEIQLLKAFLFAVRGTNAIAAQYCRLARSELAQSEVALHVRPEIDYLAHYVHRGLGKEKCSKDEFVQSLKLLENSQAAWEPSPREPNQLLHSRYFISWITTCREIAATGVADFSLDARWKDRASKAYQGCLDQLERDLPKVDQRYAKLESYQTARAAQNVMFAFIFDKYDIGGWRGFFADVIRPTEEHARRAWDSMRQHRASRRDWDFLKNMTRNDLAFAVGSYLFSESSQEHSQAWAEVEKLEAFFKRDTIMQGVVRQFISKTKR